jgi:hypothetical protein
VERDGLIINGRVENGEKRSGTDAKDKYYRKQSIQIEGAISFCYSQAQFIFSLSLVAQTIDKCKSIILANQTRCLRFFNLV